MVCPGANKPRPAIAWLFFARAQLYNPIRTVEFRYEDCGVFDLAEIRQRIAHYVSCDDDILTQFLDVDEIASRLSTVATFEDIVSLLNDMHGAAKNP